MRLNRVYFLSEKKLNVELHMWCVNHLCKIKEKTVCLSACVCIPYLWKGAKEMVLLFASEETGWSKDFYL